MEIPLKGKSADSRVLRNIPFFSCLSQHDLEDISKLIRRKKISRNQVVLFEEDTANYMYIIYSGRVRAVKLNEEGKEQILSIHKRNDFFGEMSILDGRTAPATVIAMEESEVGLLERTDFEHYLLNNQRISRDIIMMLCGRLRDAWMMIKVMSFANAEQRIIAVLDRMQSRYGVNDQRGTIINLKMTHAQIANFASVSRETATRILNRLNKEGQIEILENKTILLKVAFLKRIDSLHFSATPM
jgi:CRP/FNR family transcriptional regulator, cyclic AMP receptor protein